MMYFLTDLTEWLFLNVQGLFSDTDYSNIMNSH